MGQELTCVVRFGELESAGKAQLETDDIRFRGDFRLRIPLRDIQSLETAGGALIVAFPEGVARFELGARAEKWAEAIRNPRRLIDKLDVKPGARVAVIAIDDGAFREQLAERAPDALWVDRLPPGEPFDLIFLGAESQADLDAITTLVPRLQPAGGVWVVAPKGVRQVTEMDVLLAGRAAGLKDVKVARFSASHTAHKFVIPRENR